VDAAAQPTLLDWGAGDAVGALTLTEWGLPPGTPGYRSPQAECFRGPGAYACTPQDDLYALGVTFYVALTEAHPFPLESREQLSLAVAHGQPVVPHVLNPRVPEPLGLWVSRLMATRVEERFASAPEALEALRAVLDTPGVDWSGGVYTPQPPRPPRGEPTQPPTTGDGPPADDLEVLARHALSALRARNVDERHEAALVRRDALLAEAAARAQAVAAPARDEAPPAGPEAGPPVPEPPPTRAARGWRWAVGVLLVLTVGVGLLWKGRQAPPARPVTSSRLESAPPAVGEAATLPPASALPVTPTQEGPPVNPSPPPVPPASAPPSGRSPLVARTVRCVVGVTLAATQAACAGIPLRPAREACPAGAVQAMKELGFEPFESMEIWLDHKAPDEAREGVYREGPITSEVINPRELRYALITGRAIFGGDGKMYVRYTTIQPKGSSKVLPFCAQIGNAHDEPGAGLRMKAGSTPKAMRMGAAATGYTVDAFF
jgi:serine/threonine-protein kinase